MARLFHPKTVFHVFHISWKSGAIPLCKGSAPLAHRGGNRHRLRQKLPETSRERSDP